MGTASTYTQGYSDATVASHASRTVESDAEFLLPYIKPNFRILDVGCGPGTITTGFVKLVPRGDVIGVDLSDEVLERARNLAMSMNLSSTKLSFVCANVLDCLPFEDATFDVVFSSQLFPHLPSSHMRHKALTEMRRVLKKGGILASRDVSDVHFYPRRFQLDELWVHNMIRVLRKGEKELDFSGSDMPSLLPFAGFGADDDQLKLSAGLTTYTNHHQRKWFAELNHTKLGRQDPYRDSWTQAGISDETIERTRSALLSWADEPTAWYVAVHCQILAWKS